MSGLGARARGSDAPRDPSESKTSGLAGVAEPGRIGAPENAEASQSFPGQSCNALRCQLQLQSSQLRDQIHLTNPPPAGRARAEMTAIEPLARIETKF